ncbi:hypothetical protein HAX54_039909 [Datura stramonium]|uniref:Uncharacterized protein n=1 Tax=Datura stramonium TaxID=4076 RepID=A0ABS8VM01_DATST|nr:hypothetical protein [Datura stramonium]
MPVCSGISKPPISLNGDGITSVASSSNESNVSQEQHWKSLKKKLKDLSDQHFEFADLDFISIDTANFEDGATDSTMPLTELVHQVQVTNESPSTKLTLPPSENVKLFQPNLTTDAEAGANQIRCSNASKDLVRPLQ